MFTFKPGKRENVGLWINLIGGTGSGKTFSAFRLASGMSGDKPFAVIDTENRRALHYGDQFRFDHTELNSPYRPKMYAEAVAAADAAGYPVIVVDSGSHCWTSVLDWQEEELDEMVKRAAQRGDKRQEWQIREAGKMSAWIKPKHDHRQMVTKLLQVRAHIIFCLRSEQKIEMVKNKEGKIEIVQKKTLTGLDGWVPICDKNLPFEATCSFLLMAANPGIPHPIKLQNQHRELFPLDKPITEESGKRLAAWASGGTPKAAATSPSVASSDSPKGADESLAAPYITADEALVLDARCSDNGINVASLMKAAGVASLSLILAADLQRAHTWVDAAIAKHKTAA